MRVGLGRILIAALAALPGILATAEAPIDVGGERQLFLDDFLIARRSGVALVLHPPAEREVVLVADRPWEGGASWAASILQEGERYRLWYRAAPEKAPDGGKGWTYTAYAESRDGIRWERPDLGLIEFQGSKQNNLVWTGPGSNMSVLRDARPDVPEGER
jgi:hypothetical protein